MQGKLIADHADILTHSNVFHRRLKSILVDTSTTLPMNVPLPQYVSKTQAESYLNSWENVPKSSFITKEMLALCTEKIMSQSYFEKMFMNEMPYPDISRMERHYGKPMEGCVLRHPVDGNVTGRFAKGGLITGREFVKIKPDHFLVQTDFSGVETRIINQMARKSGRSFMSKVEQSREALKQFADGMRHTSEKMRVVCDDLAKSKKYFQLMRDNFLKRRMDNVW